MTGSQYVYRACLACLAGPLAEQRARKPRTEGWATMLTEKRIVAIHEAGHLVVAALEGFVVFEVSAQKTEWLRIGATGKAAGGFCSYGLESQKPKGNLESSCRPFREVDSDAGNVAAYCALLAPTFTWRSILGVARQLKKQAAELVDQHFDQIELVANHLESRGRLDRGEIETILRLKSTPAAEALETSTVN